MLVNKRQCMLHQRRPDSLPSHRRIDKHHGNPSNRTKQTSHSHAHRSAVEFRHKAAFGRNREKPSPIGLDLVPTRPAPSAACRGAISASVIDRMLITRSPTSVVTAEPTKRGCRHYLSYRIIISSASIPASPRKPPSTIRSPSRVSCESNGPQRGPVCSCARSSHRQSAASRVASSFCRAAYTRRGRGSSRPRLESAGAERIRHAALAIGQRKLVFPHYAIDGAAATAAESHRQIGHALQCLRQIRQIVNRLASQFLSQEPTHIRPHRAAAGMPRIEGIRLFNAGGGKRFTDRLEERVPWCFTSDLKNAMPSISPSPS